MEVSREEIELYLNKGQFSQKKAQNVIDEFIEWKQLAQDYETPIIAYLEKTFKASMVQHARATLDVAGDSKYTIACKCGEKIDLNKVYYHVYQTAWKTISGIIEKWYKKNETIKKGANR